MARYTIAYRGEVQLLAETVGLLWVKTGGALVEQKICASSPKPDICALMSTRASDADLP
jgi:hypothetical protein